LYCIVYVVLVIGYHCFQFQFTLNAALLTVDFRSFFNHYFYRWNSKRAE